MNTIIIRNIKARIEALEGLTTKGKSEFKIGAVIGKIEALKWVLNELDDKEEEEC